MTDGPEKSRPTRSRGPLGRLAGAVTGRVVETIDPDRVIDHIDVDHLMERIDVNRLLSRVDPDRLLERIDIDALLDRVDVNAFLDRVDIDRLLDRVDIDRLADRLDVDRMIARVDLDAAVRRAGLADIVAESTGRVAGSALDLARRQIVGLDVVADRVVNRLLGRDPAKQPLGPPRLVGEQGP